MLEKTQRLEMLCADRLQEIEVKTTLNMRAMIKLVMAYSEIERLANFA